MAISALLLSALMAPAIANAQPNDGGVPVPDGGVMSGMDASGASRVSERSSTKGDPKGNKAKPKSDDSGSEGSPGHANPGGASGSSKSAAVDAGGGRSS